MRFSISSKTSLAWGMGFSLSNRCRAMEEEAGAGLSKLIRSAAAPRENMEVLPVGQLGGHADQGEGRERRVLDTELMEGRGEAGGERLVQLTVARLELPIDPES